MGKKNKKSILEKLKEHHLVSDGIEYLLGIITISLPLLATYFFNMKLFKKILELKSLIFLIMLLIAMVASIIHLTYICAAKTNQKIMNVLLEEKNRISNEEIYSRVDAVIFINKLRNIDNSYSSFFYESDIYELFTEEYENANNSDKLKIIDYTINKIK